MWYYESDGVSRGPVDIVELRRLIASGLVLRATRVWRDGFRDWMAADQTELAASFAQQASGQPPTLPPPQLTGMVQGLVPAATPALAPLSPAYTTPAAYAQAAPAPGAYAPGGYGPASYGPASSAPPYARGVHYAGFWIRVAAVIIDTIILQVVLLPVRLVVSDINLPGRPGDPFGGQQLVLILLSTLIGIAYIVGFNASAWQGTPGKRVLGIHIITANGGRPGVGLAIGRYFAQFLSSLILGIGLMMAGWTDQKKALHDMICGTRVIWGRAGARPG